MEEQVEDKVCSRAPVTPVPLTCPPPSQPDTSKHSGLLVTPECKLLQIKVNAHSLESPTNIFCLFLLKLASNRSERSSFSVLDVKWEICAGWKEGYRFAAPRHNLWPPTAQWSKTLNDEELYRSWCSFCNRVSSIWSFSTRPAELLSETSGCWVTVTATLC